MRRAPFVLAAAVSSLAVGSVAAADAPSPPTPVQFKAVDDRGIEVELPRRPQRLVSLAPSNTELLYALGLGSLVVGVTEYCDYPAAAVDVANVASYSDMSVERVTAVKPDLVIAARGNDLESLRGLELLGIPAFALDIQSIPSLLNAIERLGRLVGAVGAADSLISHLRERVDRVHEMVAERTVHQRPRVLWGYWGDPIYTAGAGSLIDHLIGEAGGVNVAAATPVRWPQVSLESIVSWAPDLLVTTHLPSDSGGIPTEIEKLRRLDGWKMIPAVRSGHVYHIEADIFTRAGPRLIDGLEHLAALLDDASHELNRPVD